MRKCKVYIVKQNSNIKWCIILVLSSLGKIGQKWAEMWLIMFCQCWQMLTNALKLFAKRLKLFTKLYETLGAVQKCVNSVDLEESCKLYRNICFDGAEHKPSEVVFVQLIIPMCWNKTQDVFNLDIRCVDLVLSNIILCCQVPYIQAWPACSWEVEEGFQGKSTTYSLCCPLACCVDILREFSKFIKMIQNVRVRNPFKDGGRRRWTSS